MMRIMFALSVLSLSVFNPALAQQPDPATRVDDVVKQWMTDYKVQGAEVAVAQNGRLLGSFGHGWEEKAKEPLGSLSKAITGLCIAELIDKNRLHMSDTVGALLPNLAPKDPRFLTITVEQLLTHHSGIARDAFNDASDKNIDDAFNTALQTPLENNPGSAISYSNSGYIVLGYLIEKITAQPYEKACSHVFTQAGLARDAGVIDPTLAARASNGGWAIDAIDYARMLATLDPKRDMPGKTSAAWLLSLNDEKAYANGGPCGRFQPKASYGFGFCRQATDLGLRFYHDGLVHHHKPNYMKTGGSFFYMNEAGLAAVVIFSGENGGDAYKALETGIIAVIPAQ